MELTDHCIGQPVPTNLKKQESCGKLGLFGPLLSATCQQCDNFSYDKCQLHWEDGSGQFSVFNGIAFNFSSVYLSVVQLFEVQCSSVQGITL